MDKEEVRNINEISSFLARKLMEEKEAKIIEEEDEKTKLETILIEFKKSKLIEPVNKEAEIQNKESSTNTTIVARIDKLENKIDKIENNFRSHE